MPHPHRTNRSDPTAPTTHPTSVGTDPVSHICPLCEKAFGKSTKLERHLLQHHSATLSHPSDVHTPSHTTPHTIFPPTTPPPNQTQPTPLSLTHTLDAVLSASDHIFDAGSTHCRLCPAEKVRPFATRKDLAVHLVAKHATMRSDPGVILSASPPADTPLSARSQIHPGKRAANDVLHDSPVKRARVERVLPVSGTKPPVTPKARAGLAPKTSALAACRADGRSDASPQAEHSPKGSGSADCDEVAVQVAVQTDARAASGGAPAAQTGPGPQTGVKVRQTAPEMAAAVLDFSAMAGIFANKHKSYYRLVDA